MYSHTFSSISAQALVPEQLVTYVTAVGESHPGLFAGCIGYDFSNHRTLIAYTPGSFPDTPSAEATAAMNAAVADALINKECSILTVLGPARPAAAPHGTAAREDTYAFLPLPLAPPGQNLRNMLRRGARECTITVTPWSDAHAALVNTYIETRPLEAGTRHIYSRIEHYLAASPDAVLFSAQNTRDNSLLAFAIGDYSSLTTAFYMFAFRATQCPPGVADALLRALVAEAEERGHQYMNLGLGINKGIAAFKSKWGQALLLPCVQTAWNTEETTQSPDKAKTRSAPAFPSGDALAVFTPPSFKENLRQFLRGKERPFACLQIEVTSHCPAKCSYCPHTTKSTVWRSRRMEDATFAALLPLIKQTRRVHLQGWGEPLLHPRFFDYAAAAVRVGCSASTTTYGMAVTPENAVKLVTSGIDIVAFSLTGVDEASNAARCGVPFAKVREGIINLNRAKKDTGSSLPHVHLAYLMLASQAEHVTRLPELMQTFDVSVAVVSTLDYIAAPGMEREAYAPHETEKIEQARVLLQQAAARALEGGRTIHYSLPGEHGRNDCNEHAHCCMYIDADGVIAPCIYVNLPTEEDDPCRRTYGSVREKDPLTIWNDPAYAAFRKRLASGDPDKPCVSCAKRFERLY